MSLILEIVTPGARVYNESVSSVVIPTDEGEIGVLEGHIPIIANLLPGELQVERQGKNEFLAIDHGYVQILGDKVSVLTEAAINVENIDLETTEKARKAAENELASAQGEEGFDPAKMEFLEAQARFAMAKELIKRKRG